MLEILARSDLAHEGAHGAKRAVAHPGGAGMGCGDGAQDRQPVRPARPVLGPQYDVVQLLRALPHREVASVIETVRAPRGGIRWPTPLCQLR